MLKTTVSLSDEVARQTKLVAAYVNKSAHKFMADAIRDAIERETRKSRELGALVNKAIGNK